MGIVKEILKNELKDAKLSTREIGNRCRRSHTTIIDYTSRIQKAGFSEEDILKMTDAQLEEAIFKKEKNLENHAFPDFKKIHKELSGKGVTLQLLWEEYRETNSNGYGRSQFYSHYKKWLSKLEPEFRQNYQPGEKAQVDFAGQTIQIKDPESGETKQLQVFVMVLCSSNYTYAEACPDQSLKSWIRAHMNAFSFYGGVPKVLVPDNLKSGITKACFYEPTINQTYEKFVGYYDSCVLPARKRKPKDKAKVENGVLQVERRVLAALRNLTFHSISEVNTAIKEKLFCLNTRPSKVLGESRQSYFEKMERNCLLPLPVSPYQFIYWKQARVLANYHVEYDGSHYSVPYRLIKQKVWILVADWTIEIVHREERVASHLRSYKKGHYATLIEHMPENHREISGWTADKMISKAKDVGDNTEKFIKAAIESCKHPEQGIRKCLGIFNLEKRYGGLRLENATKRALQYGALSYKQVKSILEKGLDYDDSVPETFCELIDHENIRGPAYYTKSSIIH